MSEREYNLEQRTLRFAVHIITNCKKIRLTEFNRPLVHQVIRSATSIGANYNEANGASSRKDFRSKISLCRKESKETLFWLRLISELEEVDYQSLTTEADELCKIFGRIIPTIDSKPQSN